MKQLTCEMCGSTDLMKQEGIFICQSCGMKYSAEEAKKLMIEGTVKIDNKDKIENWKKSAREQLSLGNNSQAQHFYTLILEEDSEDYEALFFSIYCIAVEARIFQLMAVSEKLYDALSTITIKVLAAKPLSEARTLLELFFQSTVTFYSAMYQTCKNHVTENWPNIPDIGDYISRICDTYIRLICLGNAFATTDQIADLAVPMLKEGVKIYYEYQNLSRRMRVRSELPGKDRIMLAICNIKKYEPSYIAPTFTSNTTNTQSSNSGGGCYVATAVYGSYECPEVWTLRRYRDYTLAETWYGRAFVKTYYAISPTLVKWFGHTEWFKKMWRGTLDRMVSKLQANGVESTPYEDINW